MLKSADVEHVVDSIEAARAGRQYLCPETIRALDPRGAGGPGLGDLTPRERQVLLSVTKGDSTRKIAQSLGISPRTVDTHRANIARKLGSSSVAVMVRWAMREGLLAST